MPEVYSDVKSMGTTALASNTFGILMKRAVKSAAKASKKDKETCQAYRFGTDYNQRPGAIFHALVYHLLSSERLSCIESCCALADLERAVVILVALIIHQTLRGLSGNSLGTLYRIIPAPVGKWGLSSSGAVMIYFGVQIFSYKCAVFSPLQTPANAHGQHWQNPRHSCHLADLRWSAQYSLRIHSGNSISRRHRRMQRRCRRLSTRRRYAL